MKQLSMLTLFAADSHVNRTVLQVSGKEPATNAGYGQNLRALLKLSSQGLCSLKTCQGLGRVDCKTCWPILPSSGSMRNGMCFERPKRVPRTFANAYSCFPTPTASPSGTNRGGAQGRVGAFRPSLGTMATQGKLGIPGKLNPAFVEWLMGYQIGHTACDFSAIQSSRSKRR